MLKYFKILILILLLYSYANAQDGIDSCSLQAERITNTWERLKPRFEEFAITNLLQFINQDSVLKCNFFNGESANFKNLQLQINPILKLSSDASEYSFKENICKYFVFDTINFDCVATFYLNDSLVFYLTRGHNDCDEEPLCPGGCSEYNWCKDKLTFMQYFIKENKPKSQCIHPYFKVKRSNRFTFFVDGLLSNSFTIINNEIIIIPPDFNHETANPHLFENLDQPNEYIKNNYGENWIQHFARFSCSERVPWWRFWDWFNY